ncbi:hypothetical protein OG194_17770 [Streptomyces sp. NBC_01288]|uniref:hypothetical protein n=1 Tax=Streptomyces sp. NBC_01288 TaxID=2903814 RepID=UPI002E1140F8|nr:hypothetical protein OG194_17770 [Streptomyces sp. NBC_01288]
MNRPAALPGAALRVTRTAVGRRVCQRVLQVALLVGGLFVLGVVFGGQAQAAEGGPVPAKPVNLGKPGIPVVASVVKSVPVLVLVPETTAQVVQPVADVVKTVTEVLAKAQVPPLSSLPALPSLPAEPTLPVRTLPAQSTPVPVPATPQPSHGSGSKVGVVTAHRHASEPAAVSTHVAVSVTYGPSVGAVGRAVVVRHAPSSFAGRTPTRHQAPAGDPDGAQRNQSGVDNGGSRHCDACAVTLGFRVSVRIVPGVVAGADAAETRDRYRDVPVFPG